MRLNCPLIGERDIAEFVYHGDATVARPALDAAEAAWFDAVYQRTNPAGLHTELWQHTGSRLFFRVVRHMVTHKIESVELAGPWAGYANAGEHDA